jgi:hypothetical protein
MFRFAWPAGRSLAALVLASCAALGCGPVPIDADASVDGGVEADSGPVDAGPPRAIFELPRTPEVPFFDLPWPSDLRRTADGHVDATGFPNPLRAQLITRYVAAIAARQRGFATNGAVYFRFSRPVDRRSLPGSIAETLAPTASVFLVDVDPDSPTRLERHPAVVGYQDTATLYWAERTVAIRPVHGIPLAGGRTYAAVVTGRVRARSGETFERDYDFRDIVGGGGDGAVADARATYRPAFDAIVESGVSADQILALAVFTTEDPVAELAVYRDWMHAEYPAPTPRDAAWMRVADRPNFQQIEGRYGPVPVFQEGAIPYAETGGAMEPGPDGEPVVASEYDARFALTVPTTPMPATGYPIVLYAHGTGGSFRSFLSDGTGSRLASLGIACMGIDQIHHGERNPTTTTPELLFFNVINPDAARDNNRQSALDIVQQARVVPSLAIPLATADRGGAQIVFDPDRVWFFGHSQGGLVGPLFLGIDDGASAGVISAGSAVLAYALLEKTDPLSIPDVVRLALELPGANATEAFAVENFSFEHPVITLVQGWIEASDGSNFGALAFASPRPGFAPKSILSTEGLMDTFSPPGSIEALAVSMRVPPLEPVSRPIAAYPVLGIAPMSPPVSGNVAGGAATAGLLQFPADGHFAVFDNTTAQEQIRGFFASLVAGTPAIPAPGAP